MAQSLPSIVSGEGGLTRYLEEIRRFPMLAAAGRVHARQAVSRSMRTPSAAHKLVTSHLRLVAKIAMGYRGYGLPIGEVISEGNVGLMQAVKKFEPERGFRLATYAMWWIKAAIQEYILRSWSLVKMGTTANQKRLFFNLRKVEGQDPGARRGRPEARPGRRDRHQAERQRGGSGVDEPPPVRRRLAQRADPRLRRRIRRMAGLAGRRPRQPGRDADRAGRARKPPRHAGRAPWRCSTTARRRIFEARRLADEPMTLEELSAEFDISRERVRQIEVRAFEKVQDAVKAAAKRQTAVAAHDRGAAALTRCNQNRRHQKKAARRHFVLRGWLFVLLA